MRALALACVAALAACATPNDAFNCTDSSQCKNGTGTCESTGFCSFADTTCPSGKRYGEFAGGGLGGQCWVNPNGDFDVASAAATSYTSITVTFDAPPDPAAAVVLANYAIDGLTVTGTPTLTGSTVTLTTSPQSATTYTVTASNITRASDAAPLVMASSMFTGRASFNVASAVSTTHTTVQVMFDGPPEAASGTTLTNYDIPGLTLSGTPVISGNTVTLTTSPQTTIDYTVTVTGVRRSDGEALVNSTATFLGRIDFNVVSAASLNSATVTVTFDAPPDATEATTLANYSISGLTLSGTPSLSGNTVTLHTTAQLAQTYGVMVTNVTRASDGEPLNVSSANFVGINTFNVASANAPTAHSVQVVFDAQPNPTQATTMSNYTIPGLTVAGTPTLSGNTVTLPTTAQSGTTTYTVMVANVTRASDAEPLATSSAMFMGRAPFDVQSAAATGNTKVAVTFDAAPNSAQAMTLANYSIPGLTLSGTPSLSGNTVTLTTTSQTGGTYTVTVMNVTRQSDSEALSTNAASFTGRTSFNVSSATPTSTTKINVLFDAQPNSGQATTAANYSIPGLTVTGATLSVNTVTLTVSAPQSAISYTVTVSNVTRNSDGEPLTVKSATFTGRPPFDVQSATSTSNTQMSVTFDAAPNSGQAVTLGNYVVTGGAGLTLSSPSLTGNVVTFTTTPQVGSQGYTVTVSNVTRASDSEALTVKAQNFTGKTGFNVSSAVSVDSFHVAVTFDAVPNAAANTASNYTIPGLTVTAASLSGSTATLTTTMQSGPTPSYTVTVNSTNVLRQSDSVALSVNMASFSYTPFNVISTSVVTSHSITLTYDATPDAGATNGANYMFNNGLMVNGTITIVGNTVTIPTTAQSSLTTYTVTVTGVMRASDGSVLTTNTSMFTGRDPFDVTAASSPDSGTMTVTYDFAPNAAQATTLGNYNVPGLALIGTPQLAGTIVTIKTAAQTGATYTVTVSGVTRASDGEPLTTNMQSFGGTALSTPQVNTVAVTSTAPNNGTTFYNTGTANVTISGKYFTGVSCPSGVVLDDPDATHPTSCTVVSDAVITATFPAGISTNGGVGWNVKVTNAFAQNPTSLQTLVTKAGLLVSEVYQGSSGGGGNNVDHEFIELYNPTGTSINISTLGLKFHLRGSTGTDTVLNLTVTNTTLNSHGFYLLASAATKNTDAWFSHKDATYDTSVQPQLTDNSGVYISLSSTSQAKVIDKLGYGTQPAGGYETTAIANIPLDNSAQRKPANMMGDATDTDVNSADFNAASTAITPKGTLDPVEP